MIFMESMILSDRQLNEIRRRSDGNRPLLRGGFPEGTEDGVRQCRWLLSVLLPQKGRWWGQLFVFSDSSYTIYSSLFLNLENGVHNRIIIKIFQDGKNLRIYKKNANNWFFRTFQSRLTNECSRWPEACTTAISTWRRPTSWVRSTAGSCSECTTSSTSIRDSRNSM